MSGSKLQLPLEAMVDRKGPNGPHKAPSAFEIGAGAHPGIRSAPVGQPAPRPAPVDPVRALVAAGREARAFARLAALLLLDHRPVVPASLHSGDDVIVLIHGLFATAGVLRPMRQRIEQVCGAHTATFTYAPGPGVAAIAASLGRLLSALPPDVRVHLVGHSLGGLVARWYVQRIAADRRIVQTIAIG